MSSLIIRLLVLLISTLVLAAGCAPQDDLTDGGPPTWDTASGTAADEATDTGDDPGTAADAGGDGTDTDGATDTGPDGPCAAGTPGADDPFADCVVSFEPAGDAGFGHDALPDIVLGPPVGGGENQGSLDVVSLGCGGTIVLGFANPIVDGPGPDLIVFENAFVPYGGSQSYAEPAEVALSDDGVEFVAFPCDAAGPWPHAGCAGVSPVVATPENGVDATDPEAAGGDAFDLADLGLAAARYLRLTDRTALLADPGGACTGDRAGFDLDAATAIPF